MNTKITIKTEEGLYDIVPKETIQIKNKNIEQAESAVNNLLKLLNVSKIIYVDDKCSINELKDDFIGKQLTLKSHGSNEELFIDWNLPNQVFRNRLGEFWESKNELERREIYLKLLQYENNPEEIQNSLAPISLKGHLKSKIELLSPKQYLEGKEQLLEKLTSSSKLLFLFDIDFGKAPLDDSRTGIDLAQELLNNEAYDGLIYCGIFSHLFSTQEESTKRKEFCSSHGIKKERFYTISKKRFLIDSHLPTLAEGIRNALVIDKIEKFKSNAFKVLKESFNNSLNEIDSLTPESFNHAIQKSSKQEGVWEVDTLFRLSGILTKSYALKAISKEVRRNEINSDLLKIREIEDIKTGGETPIERSQIIKIRKREIFNEGSIINTIHYPITNGDIFKIGKKEYILLTQPCNLALRSNGKRARDYNTGFLVELIKRKIKDYQSMTFAQRAICELITDVNSNDDELKIAQFSTFKIVDLHLLDLCVFNTDGVCKINLNNTNGTGIVLSESWSNRYKILVKKISQYVSLIKVFNRIRSKDKSILEKSVFNFESLRNLEIDNSHCYNVRTKVMNFDIKRIENYKQPYSSDLLQKFMQYLSRNAFEHDFSELK